MKFKKWLVNFKDVDSPLGDLAKEVADDKEFPNNINSLESLSNYLHSHNATNNALEAAKNAYIYYALDEKLVRYENGDLIWKTND
ncbi:YozE family protein [Carnobacterium maltaromaticum]|uniref:YozE family protein n=1 Tax=Carnobacterium maltaromaticum TaxID=2751 RepID=UPI003B97E0BF